jgi:hypothetical protein
MEVNPLRDEVLDHGQRLLIVKKDCEQHGLAILVTCDKEAKAITVPN